MDTIQSNVLVVCCPLTEVDWGLLTEYPNMQELERIGREQEEEAEGLWWECYEQETLRLEAYEQEQRRALHEQVNIDSDFGPQDVQEDNERKEHHD